MTFASRRLFLALVLAASALLGAFAANAAAAPVLGLHVKTPQTFEPGEPLYMTVAVENVGDVAFNGPITVENTFPEGVEPVAGQVEKNASYGGEFPPWECTLAGQTSTCESPTLNPVTGEGMLPGGQLLLNYRTAAEPGAAGTLVQRVAAEGGGAFEAVSEEQTMYVGPPKPFGFRYFSSALTNKDGSSAVQAGSSPAEIATSFDVASKTETIFGSLTETVPSVQWKDTVAHLPPGLIGNPNATAEKCTVAQLIEPDFGQCPPDSQVGYARIFKTATTPLYNMVAPPGVPAQFGFVYVGVPTVLRAELRPDYGVDVANRNAVISLPLTTFESIFWGVPADSSHDTRRGTFPDGCLGGSLGQLGTVCPTEAPRTAFLRLPTRCPDQPLRWEIESNSYLHPETWAHASTTTPAPVGCNQVEFTPTMEARPTTNVGDAPSGLEFRLHLPQNDDPDGLAEAHLKDAVVTLPPGLTVNPASANGLGACAPAQIGLTTAIGQTPVRFTQEEANCPDPSRLGSVQVDTPVIDHPLHGSIYLATPYENPYNTLIALYFAVEDPETGIIVKIPARVSLDPVTGRLKAITEETPQLPFDDFRLNFDPGPHASLRTPASCGSFASESVMRPWTAPEGADAFLSDSFQIVKGANGGECVSSDSQLPHNPSFSAGTLNPKGGAFSPFALKVVRADGTQPLRVIDTTLPPGLLAKLAGVSYCPEAQIAAAAAKSGAAEQASPSCPVSSRVGGVNAGAGAGPSPFYAKGTAYLAGPYKGAPYSLAVIVPAVAGPFDLGTVVVRAAIDVDPQTAQVHAVSDPIPTILQGIPLDVRSVAVNFDRESFTLNPTSCDPMAVIGTIGSVFGQNLGVSNPFQVGGCQDLGFKPKLSIRLKGGTQRGQHPKLRAVLRARPGDANIARARVTLPHSEFLDQGHLRDICTRVQFAAHQCPAKSVYGYAKAVSPLLDYPLEGPVYLRSSSHKLPDLVVALGGQIEVALAATIDTGKNKGLRSTFEVVPDAPVTEFVLSMKGGRKGLLQNSTDICARKHRVSALFEAHNGKTADLNPVLQVSGCKKGQRDRRNSKKRK